MLEFRCHQHFTLEPLRTCLGRDFGRKKLDDNPPVESALVCKEEPTHASRGELPLDLVGVAEGCLETILKLSRQA
jgi:hypothetical protein